MDSTKAERTFCSARSSCNSFLIVHFDPSLGGCVELHRMCVHVFTELLTVAIPGRHHSVEERPLGNFSWFGAGRGLHGGRSGAATESFANARCFRGPYDVAPTTHRGLFATRHNAGGLGRRAHDEADILLDVKLCAYKVGQWSERGTITKSGIRALVETQEWFAGFPCGNLHYDSTTSYPCQPKIGVLYHIVMVSKHYNNSKDFLAAIDDSTTKKMVYGTIL